MSLVQKVFDSGVVGAGGAGFPTHVKLSSKVDIVIANGVECEPLLWSDKVVMSHFAKEVIGGIALAMGETGAKKGLIALKDYAKAQKKSLEDIVKRENLSVEIIGVPDFYPSGDEHVLINYLTSYIIPEKGIPTNEKILVNNINTLRNIYLANQDKPVTEVIITLNGELANPGVYNAPVGTRVSDLLRLTGNSINSNCSIIEGGPLTGKLIDNIDDPISKTSGGVLVLPSQAPAIASKKTGSKKSYNIGIICNQCRRCTDYCPRFLLGHDIFPNEAMTFINYGIKNEKALKSAVLCCDCGICDAFACDMGLSPRKYMKALMGEVLDGEKAALKFLRPEKIRSFAQERRVPAKKLINKLGIFKYTKPLEFIKKRIEPELVVLKLSQGFGKKSKPTVKEKDNVRKAQLIAQADGEISSNIHSPVNGIVERVSGGSIRIKVTSN